MERRTGRWPHVRTMGGSAPDSTCGCSDFMVSGLMYRYIDPAGNIQGPFPIEKMRRTAADVLLGNTSSLPGLGIGTTSSIPRSR